MAKPVEIEIIMKDRLSGGLDKAGRKVDELKGKTSGATSEMERLNRQSDSVRSTVSKIAGAFAVKELVSNIVKVRGEFQQLEVSFNTMLGSEEKSDALMQQLIRTVATTPFDLQSVANGAKQLLAYGENVDNVNDDLIRLGNISAGLNQPLSDLVYLYGTTMTQGRLYTQDYNQFVGRGIPLGRELANVLGVAESQVREMVEAGKVGFPEVQQALQNLTNEGGMFYNLMEEQSKTITGRISNIEDSISMMFNKIGQQSEGIINGALDSVAYLVENYEQVGRVLLGLVGTYGVYRTACMAVAAAHSLQAAGIGALTTAEAIHYGWLVVVEKAQKLLNKTMLSNPYVLLATAIAGVVAMMISMKTEAELLKEAEEEYQAAKQKTIEAEKEHLRRLEELCNVAGDESLATDTRREALNRLEQKYPDIFAKYDTEYEKLKNIKQIKNEIAELEADRSITNPANELTGVEARIKELERQKADVEYKTVSSTFGSYTIKSGGLNDQQEAELKNLYTKRKGLSEQIRKEQVNTYFENLTGVSNETLEAQIKQRENLLARMTTSQKNYGTIVNGDTSLTGTYSRDELQYQLNKLRSEQNRRNLPKESSADWAASARKNYEEALKDYNDFLSDTTNDLTKEDYEAKAKELKESLDVAKKEFDKTKLDGEKESSASNPDKEAEKQKQTKTKLGEELVKLQQQNDEAETEAMSDGIDKKLRQIDDEYNKRKTEVEKKSRELAELNKKAGVAGTNASGLTDEQQNEIDRANELNEEKRQRNVAQAYQEEFSAMQENLRAYGTYQQQKLAIAEEYATKISKASSNGEKQRLEVERDSLLARVESQELKANIDWDVVFGEFGSMFHDIIEPELEKAKAYMQTDEFRNADHDSQEVFMNAIRQMEQSLGGAKNVNFKKLGSDITAYQKSLVSLKEVQSTYADSYKELLEAQQKYEEAMVSGTQEEQEVAKEALETAQMNEAAAAQNVESMQTITDNAKKTVTDTATTLKSSMEGVVGGLQQIASGSLSGAYDGLITLGNSAEKMGGVLGKAFGKVADALEDVPIIGWIVSIIDVFKDGLSVVVGGLLDAVFNAVSGILSDILSGDLFVTIGNSLLKGIGNIFDALTWGNFSSWVGSGDSDPRLEEELEHLSSANEALAYSIDRLADEIKDTSGQDATDKYAEQMALIANSEGNTQEEMRRSGAAFTNGFLGIGGKHSSNYRIDQAMSDYDWQRISDVVGRTIDEAAGFWDLSSEEMAKVARNVPDLYAKVKNYASEGYKDAAQYMDDYIAFAEQRKELEQAYYESITQVSFDSVYDNFIDMLMDMSSGWEDFSNDMSEYLMRALLKTKLDELLKPDMEAWYKAYGEAMSDGILGDDEVERLNKMWEDLVNRGLEIRDSAASATGYTGDSNGTSQSGKSGGFTAMSQDQGTKLEGLFVSGQMHWSSMDDKMSDVSEQMGAAVDHLRRIEENTGTSARHLGEIKEDIKKIVRDGLKMK